MKMVKQILCVGLSMTMISQGALAESKTQRAERMQKEHIMKKMESLDIKDLNLNELQMGLEELKNRLAMLQEDLGMAEVGHDERVALKVRNYGTLGLGALTVLLFMSADKGTADDRMGKAMLMFLTGAATVGFGIASQGYIYFTSGELRDLENQVEELKVKIYKLDQKIRAKKARG